MKAIVRGDELLARLPHDAPVFGVEVGVWMGKLSAYLLKRHPQLTLIMVDRWAPAAPGSRYANSGSEIAVAPVTAHRLAYMRTCVNTQFAEHRARIMRGESIAVAASIMDASQDFVFIDADHTYSGVTEDLEAWVPKVRPGGLVCGHDWDHKNKLWDVRGAVEDFFSKFDGPYHIDLGGDKTWFVRLPDEDRNHPVRK